jgi:hypothetical protein
MNGDNKTSIAKKKIPFLTRLSILTHSSALPDINTDDRRGDSVK